MPFNFYRQKQLYKAEGIYKREFMKDNNNKQTNKQTKQLEKFG